MGTGAAAAGAAPLVCEVNAGFANRLRAAVSAICAAHELQRPLYIVWKVEPGICTVPFEEAFDIRFLPHQTYLLSAPPSVATHLRTCLSPTDWIIVRGIALANPSEPIYIKSHGHFYQADPPKWDSVLRSFFCPTPTLRARLTALAIPPSTIGLHIRRTDNRHSIQHSPTKLFHEAIAKLPPRTPLLLSTDDQTERAAFQERYGDRLLHTGAELKRGEPSADRDAVLDFFALASCREIYGSYYSSFSELAAAYGETPLHILRTL